MPLDVAAAHHSSEMAAMGSAHHAASTHATRDSRNAGHDDAGMPPCSHCPPPADDHEPAPTLCATDSTPNANGPQASAAPDIFKLSSAARLTTLASPAPPPPLIRIVAPDDMLRCEQTSLNIRHCVFLI